MMIRKIKWENHPFLKDLELDFQKEDDSIYNTIVLIGENGVGKTTVMNTLADFLNGGSFTPFDYIQYDVEGITYTIYNDQSVNTNFGYHLRTSNVDGSSKRVLYNQRTNSEKVEEDNDDIRHYGIVYSRARSGFQTNSIKSTTTQQLDESKYDIDQNEDYTAIKQLLVDIDTDDSNEWKKMSREGSQLTYSEFQKESKIYRFEQAFNSFFDGITFQGIDDSDSKEKEITFEKHGTSIAIDQLSTGEKQIVFRGSQLLKNIGSVSDGIILVDEPELSMHPKWQQKILQYYRGLFTVKDNQSVQMIFATHSEYVLKAALEDTNNVLIISLSDNNGTIEAKRITEPSVLPSITFAETNFLVFDMISTDYHIELYGYLQNKIGKESVKDCDNYIASSPRYNAILHDKPSSYTNKKGRIIYYKTLPTYIRNAIDHPDSDRQYTESEMRESINLLRSLCK